VRKRTNGRRPTPPLLADLPQLQNFRFPKNLPIQKMSIGSLGWFFWAGEVRIDAVEAMKTTGTEGNWNTGRFFWPLHLQPVLKETRPGLRGKHFPLREKPRQSWFSIFRAALALTVDQINEAAHALSRGAQ